MLLSAFGKLTGDTVNLETLNIVFILCNEKKKSPIKK